MGHILSTSDVAGPERLSYWCDAVCSTFVHLDVKRVLRTPSFFGSIDTRRLSDLQFSNVISEDQHVVRSPAQIAKATQDFFLISLQLTGNGSILQDSRTAHLKPGQLARYDTNRSYELLFTQPFRQMVLQMPRAQLKPLLVLPDASVAQVVDGRRGLGKIASDLIVSTWQEVDQFAPQQLERIKGMIIELLAAALNEAVCDRKTSSRSRLARLLEVKEFITSRLRSPQLGVEMIADAFQLSTRYVHLLFKDEDTTVAGYIREQRLQKCAQELRNMHPAHRSITDIAFSWGFNSSAHFSRLFSDQFGVTPSAYRALRAGV